MIRMEEWRNQNLVLVLISVMACGKLNGKRSFLANNNNDRIVRSVDTTAALIVISVCDEMAILSTNLIYVPVRACSNEALTVTLIKKGQTKLC